jgi:hypothetical protein
MFHMFAMVFNVFQASSQVFQTLVLSVSFVLFCMLQRLLLDVSKVNRMLHMGCTWKATGTVDDIRAAWVTSRAVRAHCWRPLTSLTRYALFAPFVRQHPDASAPDGRPDASKSPNLQQTPGISTGKKLILHKCIRGPFQIAPGKTSVYLNAGCINHSNFATPRSSVAL